MGSTRKKKKNMVYLRLLKNNNSSIILMVSEAGIRKPSRTSNGKQALKFAVSDHMFVEATGINSAGK